jgi:hypothetical protein
MADSGVRAIARNLMPQFLEQGMSSRAITSYLQVNYGAAYQRTVLLSDMREFAHIAKYENQTLQYSNVQPFPTSYMDERELRREAKYYIRGRAQYQDMSTGDITEEYVSMYTNNFSTKEQAEEDYLDYQVESESSPDKVVVGVEIYSVSHYKGRPY